MSTRFAAFAIAKWDVLLSRNIFYTIFKGPASQRLGLFFGARGHSGRRYAAGLGLTHF